jgi:hypothetical protein
MEGPGQNLGFTSALSSSGPGEGVQRFFQFSRAFGIPQIIFVFHKCSIIYTSLPPHPIWVWFEALISSYFYLRHAHIFTQCPLFPPQGGNRFDSYIILIVHSVCYSVFFIAFSLQYVEMSS